MRRPVPILLLALAAARCTSLDLPRPALLAVDPPAAPNASSTALTVTGQNFAADLRIDFDDPGQSSVDVAFDLELLHPSGTRFPLGNVTLVSSTEILATVPAGLTPQTYDLLLTDPRGQIALLSSALQIFQGDCSSNGAPCVSGNPCTVNDTCQGHKCQAGTPLADGTPCQLRCTTAVETCQGGVCTPPPGGCP